MKSPLHTLRTLINLHDGKDNGGDGITAGDWAEARAVAAQGEPDRIRKAASFFLTSWPDGWTGEEIIAGTFNEHPDIVVRECFQFEEIETVAGWIQEVADIFSK